MLELTLPIRALSSIVVGLTLLPLPCTHLYLHPTFLAVMSTYVSALAHIQFEGYAVLVSHGTVLTTRINRLSVMITIIISAARLLGHGLQYLNERA
ncbi:hypothetical protein BC826DRAFT_1035963 [Russula brevipes]|nr:hypothetical protein BC826DRAFT_1035963 [Russula brevipes]